MFNGFQDTWYVYIETVTLHCMIFLIYLLFFPGKRLVFFPNVIHHFRKPAPKNDSSAIKLCLLQPFCFRNVSHDDDHGSNENHPRSYMLKYCIIENFGWNFYLIKSSLISKIFHIIFINAMSHSVLKYFSNWKNFY